MDITPYDRDLAIRTMMGEAGNQSEQGLAGVGAVILNRVNDGKFGKTIGDVVLAPKQFEPWQTRSRELLSYSDQDPKYQRAAKIFDKVAAGDIPDPSNGATHFLNPDIVRQRRGGTLPQWAQGQPTATIGQHAFYAPEGEHDTVPAPAPGSLLGRFGFSPDGAPVGDKKSAPVEQQQEAYKAGSILKSFGHDISKPAEAAAPVAPRVQMIGGRVVTPEELSGTAPTQTASVPGVVSALGADRIYNSAVDAPTNAIAKVPELAGDYFKSVGDSFAASRALTASGVEDIKRGMNLPSMPSADPKSWSGGGILKTGGGILGQVFSPVSGALDVGAKEIGNITGNPEFGEKAMMLVPGPKGFRAVNEARPATRGANALIEAVGDENIPALIKRMESNPRLSPMDASESVRTMAQGLASDPANPKAQAILKDAYTERVRGAKGAVESAYNDTLGARPDVLATVEGIKQRATDAGTKAINPAVEKAGTVEVTPVIKAIDEAIGADPVGAATLRQLKNGETPTMAPSAYQQRLLELRQQLRGTWNDKEAMFLDATGEQGAHAAQTQLRAEAQNLLNSASGADRNTGRKLMDMRNKLVDAIDSAAGGEYKPALSKYRDAKQVDEAFQKGLDVNKVRQGEAGLQDRPEFWAKEKAKQSADEIEATKHGILTAVDQKINSMRRAARAGIDIPDVGFTRGKLELYFGKQQTDKLMQRLQDQKDIAETNNRLFQGSKTASTLAGRNALAVREVKPIGYGGILPPVLAETLATAAGYPEYGALGASLMVAGGLARKGAQKIGAKSDTARNVSFARLASATNPMDREAALAVLRARAEELGGGNKRMNALRAISSAAIAP